MDFLFWSLKEIFFVVSITKGNPRGDIIMKVKILYTIYKCLDKGTFVEIKFLFNIISFNIEDNVLWHR